MSTTVCTNGACEVSVCDTGYVDFDGQCANGCECKASSTQAACGNAINLFSGTLEPGQSISAFSSTMAPITVTDAYFTLTFGGNGGTNFHPIITISSTNNEFVMDVTSNCSGSLLSCADDGSGATGVTTWETQYGGPLGPSPEGDPNSKQPNGTTSNFEAIPLPGSSGQVWIKVYRKTGATPTCDSYTINASD